MNPLNDRTPKEMLPKNKHVVTFLHHVTTPQDASIDNIQAQSIARVRSRLLQEGQLEMEGVTHPSAQLTEQNRAHREKESYTSFTHKRPIWQQRLSLLVAVLCVALFASSFVAVEQIARHRSITTSASSHNVAPSSRVRDVHFQIRKVHMQGVRPEQYVVTIHKGMSIELISDDHILVGLP